MSDVDLDDMAWYYQSQNFTESFENLLSEDKEKAKRFRQVLLEKFDSDS
jgi:hypothetical protein